MITEPIIDADQIQAEKLKFCRAVIWSIIPQDMQIGDYHKGCTTISDDSELRRYAALYPARIEDQDEDVKAVMAEEMGIPETIPVVLPDNLSAYTYQGITGYPLVTDESELTSSESEYELTVNGMFNLSESMMVDLVDEYTPELSEMYEILNPSVIRQWNRGSMVIQECVLA